MLCFTGNVEVSLNNTLIRSETRLHRLNSAINSRFEIRCFRKISKVIQFCSISMHISNDPWGTKEWNWGYARGEAHNRAIVVRNLYNSETKRNRFLDELRVLGDNDDPDKTILNNTKLAFALCAQRATRERRISDGMSQIYSKLIQGNYESSDGNQQIVSDIQMVLNGNSQMHTSVYQSIAIALDAIDFIAFGL
mmetsp:Transcript_9502/g.17150  ORF Transcript_9502/g.17150 Transcript_9502/m.17150 type:complete len:194 (-) Transcript_9502:24-605(-)